MPDDNHKRAIVLKKPSPPEKRELNLEKLANQDIYDDQDVDECLKLGVVAQKAMFKRLAEQNYDFLSAGDTAHALVFLPRAGGQLLRDRSFSKGGPDSRSDMAVAAEVERAFAGLTTEQLAQIKKWREQNHE